MLKTQKSKITIMIITAMTKAMVGDGTAGGAGNLYGVGMTTRVELTG